MTALFGHTGLRVRPLAGPRTGSIRCPFQLWIPAFAVMTLMVAALPTLPARAEAPKLGGTLTYVIAADAPPSFDAHREATFATVYSGAPFYSVLIRLIEELRFAADSPLEETVSSEPVSGNPDF